MIKFSFHQIKFLSSSAVLLLCWQSLAFANPSVNKKLTLKKTQNWIAQAFPSNQDVLVPNPRILIDGKPVEMSKPPIPPAFTRAVAPPVGDMSVSTTPVNSDRITFVSDPIIPRLSLRQAPIDEVLRLLGNFGDLNVLYDYSNQTGQANQANSSPAIPQVSLDVNNEKVSSIFNNLLALYGLEATPSPDNPRLILISKNLPYSVNNTMSRSIRLNQAKAISVAAQLALLGATTQQIVETVTVTDSGGNTGGGSTGGEDEGATSATGAEQVQSSRQNIQGSTQQNVTREITVKPLSAVSDQASGIPLPLRRLSVTADERTNTITLTGTPQQISIASKFIVQADIRLRQVAVNVKIVDVQLDQQDSFGSSFSFGIDNTGVVQDGGVGVINFGTNNRNVDPNSWRQAGGELVPAYNEQIQITEGFSNSLATQLANSLANDLTNSSANSVNQSTNSDLTDGLTQNFSDTINRTLSQFGNTSGFTRDQAENLSRALTENLTNSVANTLSQSDNRNLTQSDNSNLTRSIADNISRTVSRSLQGLPLASPNSGQISPFGTNADPNNPGDSANIRPGRNFNVPQAFLAQIRANINSGNAKILTDPTLVVQEGQVGSIALVENVVTSTETKYITVGNTTQPQVDPVIEAAGLTLSIKIDKIDDNGFISLNVNPSVSAPGNPQSFQGAPGVNNVITPLVVRAVDSGLIRLRDGQTLILSGIISEGERTQVSKIPILGDLPIIGSLFRSTFKDKARSEVIVILTPQILNDSENSSGFGYNYNPSRETGQFLRDRGLNIPTNPY